MLTAYYEEYLTDCIDCTFFEWSYSEDAARECKQAHLDEEPEHRVSLRGCDTIEAGEGGGAEPDED